MNEIALSLNILNLNWSIAEIAAIFFSIIYVALSVRENILCWLFAAISTLLYIYICFNAKLFAETGLQIFYLLMAAYGYYNWNKPKEELAVSHWRVSKHLLVILFGTFLTFLMGFYFTTYTSAKMPIIDS